MAEECTLDGTCADCEDTHEHCTYWEGQGECTNNPGFMLRYCRKSCNACDKNTDDPERLQELEKEYSEAERDEYGVLQAIHGDKVDEIHRILKKMAEYVDSVRGDEKSSEEIKELMSTCQNKHAECAFWAADNECLKNP